MSLLRGTEGSNPSPSTSESIAYLTSSGFAYLWLCEEDSRGSGWKQFEQLCYFLMPSIQVTPVRRGRLVLRVRNLGHCLSKALRLTFRGWPGSLVPVRMIEMTT